MKKPFVLPPADTPLTIPPRKRPEMGSAASANKKSSQVKAGKKGGEFREFSFFRKEFLAAEEDGVTREEMFNKITTKVRYYWGLGEHLDGSRRFDHHLTIICL